MKKRILLLISVSFNINFNFKLVFHKLFFIFNFSILANFGGVRKLTEVNYYLKSLFWLSHMYLNHYLVWSVERKEAFCESFKDL